MMIIREQFMNKYGKEFIMETMSNNNNNVNARIVHKLAIQSPENYLVYQYLNEIAKLHNLDWKVDYMPPVAPSTSTSIENFGHVCLLFLLFYY